MARHRPVIEIVPVGEVPATILEGIRPVVEERFPGRVARIAMPGLPRPTYALTIARQQYHAEAILDRLTAIRGDAERVLGVADLDLYVPRQNFILGLAQSGGSTCLIALARLHPELYHEVPNPPLLLERSVKEAVHELGHTYGLDHCDNPRCVMHVSNTIPETDAKSDQFGPEHEGQLQRALAAPMEVRGIRR